MDNRHELLKGLKALAEVSFPKKCSGCEKVYESANQFLSETNGTATSATGLIESIDEHYNPIVEAYRNCVCGSTLVDFFGDRRGNSEVALKRRGQFGIMLDYLVEQGLEKELARNELSKFIRGEKSQRLKDFKLPEEDVFK
jgi:hypothetical protein